MIIDRSAASAAFNVASTSAATSRSSLRRSPSIIKIVTTCCANYIELLSDLLCFIQRCPALNPSREHPPILSPYKSSLSTCFSCAYASCSAPRVVTPTSLSRVSPPPMVSFKSSTSPTRDRISDVQRIARHEVLTPGDLSSLLGFSGGSVGCLGVNTGGELLVGNDGDFLGVGHCRCVFGDLLFVNCNVGVSCMPPESRLAASRALTYIPLPCPESGRTQPHCHGCFIDNTQYHDVKRSHLFLSFTFIYPSCDASHDRGIRSQASRSSDLECRDFQR